MKGIYLLIFGLLFVVLAFGWKDGFTQTGVASYYADSFQGKKTYSGEKYDKKLLTAAHISLPINTLILVTNLKNDSTVVVKINDRIGTKKRILDLSRAAAEKLNFIRDGVVKVKLEVVEK